MISSISLFAYLRLTQAAVITWDGGGTTGTCGAGNENNWSCAENWSGDVAPGSGDIATFDNTSDKDATIDASFGGSVAGVDINSGYDGTITQARSLAVGGDDFNQASGIWDGGAQNLDIGYSHCCTPGGDFIISGGTFTAPTGTWTLEGNLTHSGGTLTMTGATVNLDGSDSVDDTTITCSGSLGGTVNIGKSSNGADVTIASGCTVDVNNITPTSVGTITVGGTMNVSGTFDVSNSSCCGGGANLVINNGGTVTYSNTSITIEGNFTQNGTFDLTGMTITFDGSDSVDDTTITCSGSLGGTVNVSKSSGDFTLASGCNISLGTTFDIGDGTVVINGAASGGTNLTAERNFTIGASGSLSYSGVLTFDGSSSTDDTTFTCTGTHTDEIAVVKTTNGANFTLSSGCSITLDDTTDTQGSIFNSGTIDIPSGITVNVEQSFGSSGGTLTGTGTVEMDGTSSVDDGTFACSGSFPGTVIITKTDSDGNVTVDSGCSITLGDATNTSGNFTNNGTISIASGHDANFEGDFLSASGTVNNEGTLIFDGTSSLSDTDLSCNGNIGNVIINKTSSDGNTTLLSSCTVNDLTRTDGPILNPASAYTLTITGDLSTSTTDTFGGANMTVEFGGTSAQTITRTDTTISTPIIVNKTSGTVTQLSDITVPSLTITDGEVLNSTLALTVSGTLTVNDTFTQGSGTVTAGTYTIGSTGTYQTTSTGDLVIGAGGVSNSGNMTIGSQSSCPGADSIDITSSSPSTQRSWTGSGKTRIYDATITDQGGTQEVVAFSSTESTNVGDNFAFVSGCALATHIGGGLRLGDGARLR